MKHLAVLLSAFSSLYAAPAPHAELAQVHMVYILPMTNGLDQYLANALTDAGLLPVVTDPSKADAVFTDRLGGVFEARMNELFPPAIPSKPKAESDKDKEQPDRRDEKAPVPNTTFGRGKGTLFLVDVSSRRVIWSTYARPKNATSKQLNHTARVVADRLKDALQVKDK